MSANHPFSVVPALMVTGESRQAAHDPIADIASRAYCRLPMAATVSRGVYHHGKRHRFEATAKDDSPEAFQAALAELDGKVRAFRNAIAPKVVKPSYRKKKGS
jgi:hypothetical protein